MADDALGESLLERILNDDIQPITDEAKLNTEDLKEIHQIDHERNFEIREEQIIEDSIEELQKEAHSEENFEMIETSPEEWLSNTVKEISQSYGKDEYDKEGFP